MEYILFILEIMSNLIIIDRKHKRANSDNTWTDALGVDDAKREKARTIEIPKGSKNPAHQVMATQGTKGLLGRKAWCFNSKQEVVTGFISQVLPPHFIHLKNKGVFKLDDVFSIGG